MMPPRPRAAVAHLSPRPSAGPRATGVPSSTWPDAGPRIAGVPSLTRSSARPRATGVPSSTCPGAGPRIAVAHLTPQPTAGADHLRALRPARCRPTCEDLR
ncbi:hypothetical protein [Nocardia sp. NRRL S-836]|uniref:hypothetical protein n=1 Tax=Nocardia sp. NRRL S-836 TaxID=1519492 RepID=UPI0012F80303|nr:hypothetical protein [Nocardia sp. NRRL S-836]